PASRATPRSARVSERRTATKSGSAPRQSAQITARLGRRAIRQQPNFQPGLRVFAVACVKAGELEEGRAAIARMRELNPAFRVSSIKDVMTLRRPEDLAAYEDALRVAELPD